MIRSLFRFLRQEYLVVSAMGMILVIGTVGYHLLERMTILDALYMTVITISTVGFGEVDPLDPAGKLFTLGLISASAIIVAYFVGIAAESLLQGEWRVALMRRRRRKMFEELREHAIVCGHGRVGRHVVAELRRQKIPTVVIDASAEPLTPIETDGLLTVHGDATDEEVLRQAGVERARYLISALATDADNVFVVLTARSINPDLTIVARTNSEDAEAKLLKAGADRCITPYKISAHRMVTMLLRPDVADFLDSVMYTPEIELVLEQADLAEDSPLVGKTLGEAQLRSRIGVTVIALREPGAPLVTAPGPNVELVAGARLIVLGTRDQVRAFCALASGTDSDDATPGWSDAWKRRHD